MGERVRGTEERGYQREVLKVEGVVEIKGLKRMNE